jgi:aryl-alcohol dehydrogenase-like predicted oxidoreductase
MGLPTATWPAPVSYTQQAARDRAARFRPGITRFDNANQYGPLQHAVEKIYGRVLRSDLAPYRDELILTTKAGNPIGPALT